MADISVQQKKAGSFTWLWAVVAIAAIIGLMIWLATQQGTSALVGESGAGSSAAVQETGAQAEAVDLATVGAEPNRFQGREIRVSGVPVAAVLGNRAFWADVPGANPVLVILGPQVQDTGWLNVSAVVNVLGSVEPVNDAVVGEWVQNETIRPGARDEASFATHYLLVDQVEQ